MDSDEPTLKFDYSEFGIMIHKAAIQKFKGSNSLALKSKTLPELVIAQWKKACKPLSQEDATLYIMDLIQSLTQNDVDEIASPSGYKRNCGKKRRRILSTCSSIRLPSYFCSPILIRPTRVNADSVLIKNN